MTVNNTISAKQRFSVVMSTCSIISALLVVWIHAYNVEVYNDSNRVIFWLQEAVSQGIARGAVPFFLMSSAFFLYSKEKKVWEVYKSRSTSVVIPYLLWNIVYMIVFAVLQRLNLTTGGMETVTVSNVAQGIFLHKYNYAYWFMRDLIVLVALYPLMRWIIRRGKAVSFLWLGGLVIAYYCGATFLDSAFYYSVGAIIGYHYQHQAVAVVEMKKTRLIGITAAWLCVAVSLFVLKNVMKIDDVEMVRDLVMAFLMFFAVVSFDIRIVGAFAGLSFMIYSLHPMLLEVVEKCFYLCLPHTDLWMLLDYVVAPVICLAMIWGVCFVWKKLLPKTYKLFNGGRL